MNEAREPGRRDVEDQEEHDAVDDEPGSGSVRVDVVHLAEQVEDPPARAAFTRLADWEKGHELFFREFRDKLTEEYGSMPWGG